MRHLAELRIHRIFAAGLVFMLAALCSANPGAGEEKPAPSRVIQQKLTHKYPGQKIVNWCSGKILGRGADAVAVLHNQAKKQFLVLWVTSNAGIQELDSVAQDESDPGFELQCLDANEAKQRKTDFQTLEAIEGTLEAPEGLGAVCYFTDSTSAKCWSLDRASGRLVEVGGWQT